MSKELTTSPGLAHAAELARNGEYTHAVQMLRELGGRGSTDPVVLDLLARIHAQRGELFDADECWALALRLDPDFAPARAGRQRIAALVARRMRPRTGRVALTAVLTAVVVTGAGVGTLIAETAGPDPAVLAGLDDVQNSQREQAERLDRIDDQLDQTALRKQRTLDNLNTTLAGNPEFIARADADAVVVTFPAGVFRTGVSLSDTGSEALGNLAQRLSSFATDMSITVVGHTVDARVAGSPDYTTNAELGLARATTAAERMSEASGLPLSAFSLSSSGAVNPPFPNTTPDGRARNRTVTVVVRPR
ncbi:OmpA family protein [Saccharopolyspora erythraea]|uniref:OmpA family protein n=1 Tax=Saccharopolyspora erythraea TaxID=1836 RepID=UPI001BA7880C|nr:OmpA family protein [Saccharopolyspora erythraea]QUH04013.1 OmpA family protein [Saccharopolyspora erythraea]